MGLSEMRRAREIAAAAERVDGRPPVSDQALLAAAQGQRELVMFSPVAGVTAGTDEAGTDEAGTGAAAFGIVGEGELDLVVAPDHRGRGIGTAALRLLVERANRDAPLLAWSHGENPVADALLAHAGFTPVRSLYLMSLDPAKLPPPGPGTGAVPLPAGYTLRPFDPARPHDASEWVRVNAAAFASHPEQGRITETDFSLMREEAWFDPADLLLLEAPEGLAGYTWVKTVAGEAALAGAAVELYAIGVDPAYAGQGLGRALLEVTLARMAEHSPASVELYVDGENARAVGMYERAGFTVSSRSRQWALTP